MSNYLKAVFATLTASLVVSVSAHAAPIVLNQNFEALAVGAAVPGFSANTAVSQTPNLQKFLGAVGQPSLGLGNATATLSLNGLAGHSSVNVMFDAYILQSWDGDSGNGPDRLRFLADGASMLDSTFSNVASNNQDFPLPFGNPGSNPARTGAAASNSLGYGFFGDTVYQFNFSFAHANASLTLDWIASGLQALSDESWGIDNVKVELFGAGGPPPTGVPEPATLTLFGLGLAGLGFARRRSRKAA